MFYPHAFSDDREFCLMINNDKPWEKMDEPIKFSDWYVTFQGVQDCWQTINLVDLMGNWLDEDRYTFSPRELCEAFENASREN